ncbi:MAG: M15 family metallopeptidase, partial [Prochlorotrichaceae cyanobacterium]
LRQVMTTAGFANHPKEWWHFSYGDQLWAWLREQDADLKNESRTVACYGGV